MRHSRPSEHKSSPVRSWRQRKHANQIDVGRLARHPLGDCHRCHLVTVLAMGLLVRRKSMKPAW